MFIVKIAISISCINRILSNDDVMFDSAILVVIMPWFSAAYYDVNPGIGGSRSDESNRGPPAYATESVLTKL